ncbi:hypothetical protein D5086_018190 [Populus alba]|uniref:Uncharacterized protein n=1 Tax=Populus alba TaxID=43335 RepID=A0ACC4BNZ6_POPAL
MEEILHCFARVVRWTDVWPYSGLMSMSIVDLEVLAKSGTPKIENTQALPIFLDSLVTAGVAIVISVTLILLFGEILPHNLFVPEYGLALVQQWPRLSVFLFGSVFLLLSDKQGDTYVG